MRCPSCGSARTVPLGNDDNECVKCGTLFDDSEVVER